MASLHKARQIQEKLAPLFPAGSAFHANLDGTWFDIGFLSGEARKHDDAIHAYEQCRAIGEKLVAAHPERTDYRHHLAVSLLNLSSQYGFRGRADDALPVDHGQGGRERIEEGLLGDGDEVGW